MKKLITIAIILAAVYIGWDLYNRPVYFVGLTDQNNTTLSIAFDERKSGIQTEGNGVVIKILPDDNDGSRHQRFILELHSGQTLLITHNIDLAPRLAGLAEGDAVAFHGVYEWNPKGGVIHWTHRDPSGRHVPGWLKHKGKTYQ